MLDSANNDGCLSTSDAWFVYLLRSADWTAFKVGFTCNPLQRFHSFHHRYFEGFDLHRSALLQLDSEREARRVEAELKHTFANSRHDAPSWVAEAAGGYTEWFAALHADAAEAHLLTCGDRVLNAAEIIREQLRAHARTFEHWATLQSQLVADPRAFGITPPATREAARALRDWLDAFRYFEIDLFADDPDALEFVRAQARMI